MADHSPETFVPEAPIYRAVVREERLDKAMDAIEKAKKLLTNEQAIECLFEIGYGDFIDTAFAEGGNPFQYLTPLQLCAAATALIVYAESGGRQEFARRSPQ